MGGAGQTRSTRGKEKHVGITDKLKNTAEELEGKAKQSAGSATGDRDMQAEGLKDEKSGELKQAGEKVKDVLT
jgi:uncharacterized protein YjbJ (UPF0337 family)